MLHTGTSRGLQISGTLIGVPKGISEVSYFDFAKISTRSISRIIKNVFKAYFVASLFLFTFGLIGLAFPSFFDLIFANSDPEVSSYSLPFIFMVVGMLLSAVVGTAFLLGRRRYPAVLKSEHNAPIQEMNLGEGEGVKRGASGAP